jgi:hypothetical protein
MLSIVLAVMAASSPDADNPPATQQPATNSATNSANQPPMITRNPNGTFTVQKLPPKGDPKDAAHNGLVIEPQVIVPEFPRTDSKH